LQIIDIFFFYKQNKSDNKPLEFLDFPAWCKKQNIAAEEGVQRVGNKKRKNAQEITTDESALKSAIANKCLTTLPNDIGKLFAVRCTPIVFTDADNLPALEILRATFRQSPELCTIVYTY